MNLFKPCSENWIAILKEQVSQTFSYSLDLQKLVFNKQMPKKETMSKINTFNYLFIKCQLSIKQFKTEMFLTFINENKKPNENDT